MVSKGDNVKAKAKNIIDGKALIAKGEKMITDGDKMIVNGKKKWSMPKVLMKPYAPNLCHLSTPTALTTP
ncbi:MAG: hypothetical protein IPG70_06615 [Moraxellaceae bacterium]|nr:hypothetical protein [Moraxellaceae bacterium]